MIVTVLRLPFVLSRTTETASEVNGVTREVARLRRRTAVLSHQFFLIGFLLEVHTKVYPIVMCLRVLWGYGPTNEARKAGSDQPKRLEKGV